MCWLRRQRRQQAHCQGDAACLFSAGGAHQVAAAQRLRLNGLQWRPGGAGWRGRQAQAAHAQHLRGGAAARGAACCCLLLSIDDVQELIFRLLLLLLLLPCISAALQRRQGPAATCVCQQQWLKLHASLAAAAGAPASQRRQAHAGAGQWQQHRWPASQLEQQLAAQVLPAGGRRCLRQGARGQSGGQ